MDAPAPPAARAHRPFREGGRRGPFLALLLLPFALGLAGAPGAAAAFDLAPPGACAEREGTLVHRPAEGTGELRQADASTRGGPEASRAATGPLHHRFQPTPVAAGPQAPSVPPPSAGELPRPGPCEDPGSGCLGPLQPAPPASPPPAPPSPAPDPGFGTGPAEPPGRCQGGNCP